MEVKFDVFLRLPDGRPVWVQVVEGLEQAKKQIEQLVQVSPGEYFLYNSKTGKILEE